MVRFPLGKPDKGSSLWSKEPQERHLGALLRLETTRWNLSAESRFFWAKTLISEPIWRLRRDNEKHPATQRHTACLACLTRWLVEAMSGRFSVAHNDLH